MQTRATQQKNRLPRIHAGLRRNLLVRLVANGLAQGMTAFALTRLLHSAIGEARLGTLSAPTLGVVACCGVLALCLRVQEAADAERMGQDYVMQVRLALFEHLAGERARSDRQRRLGVSMTRMISDLSSLRNWVGIGLARSVVAVLTIAGLLCAMATIDFRVAIVLGVMSACVGGLAALITPRLRDEIRGARRQRGRLANNLGEKLLVRSTVAQFGRARREKRRIRRQSEKLNLILIRRARLSRLLRSSPSGLLPIALVTVVLVLGSGPGHLEQVAVGLLLAGLLAGSLGDLLRAWDYRLAFLEGRARIGDVLRGRRRSGGSPTARSCDTEGLGVEVADLEVAQRLSPCRYHVAAGEVALVTGASGSGKTTLLEVIAGRLEPDAGHVSQLGRGQEPRDDGEGSNWTQLVSNDIPLLRGSVRSNLQWAGIDDAQLDRDPITHACDLSRAQAGLALGLDTAIDERGQNLPSGAQARVRLARAALTRPAVLLVDDPAFSFDDGARHALEAVRAILPATFIVVGRPADPPLAPDRIWTLQQYVTADAHESPQEAAHVRPHGNRDNLVILRAPA